MIECICVHMGFMLSPFLRCWCRGFNMLHLHLIAKLSPLLRAAVKGALPEEVQCVCVCVCVCVGGWVCVGVCVCACSCNEQFAHKGSGICPLQNYIQLRLSGHFMYRKDRQNHHSIPLTLACA